MEIATFILAAIAAFMSVLTAIPVIIIGVYFVLMVSEEREEKKEAAREKAATKKNENLNGEN